MSHARTTATDLAEQLDDGDAPIYVLDDRRRIVFCNAACARWTRTKAADLVDQQCAYHAPADAASLSAVAAGLCPPPKVFAGQAQTALVSCPAPDGRLVYRRGHFWPLSDGEDESSPVIAILEQKDCLGPASETSEPECAPAAGDAQLHDHVRRFRQQMAGRFGAHSLIGTSPAIVRARCQVELASESGANVLVLGPRGSGKEHVAKAVHYGRPHAGALVPLACTLLDSNLLQSTLKALRLKHSAKPSSGTLLLNDVDCAPALVQADLAERLRGEGLGMHVIATAVKSPLALAGQRQFSQELACALSTITIELPPLAQRLEDLPLLAQTFLEEANATSTKQLGGFSLEALDQLAAYPWRGNVDELAVVVRQAHERARAGEVASRDLPNQIHLAADAASYPSRQDEAIEIEEFLAQVERELIARALRRSKGNKSKAAKLLGLTRPRLYRRLVQLGLEQPDGPSEE
jgi:DNA-binding NtrC family response regulator